MLKKAGIIFLFLVCAVYGFTYSVKENLYFRPEFSAAYYSGGGGIKNFAGSKQYSSSYADFNLPVVLHLSNNFYADINYFIRADYNPNIESSTFYRYNFSRANLNYKTDDASFKLGRQNYSSNGKDFIIYYGAYPGKDNIEPSAVDGISHKGAWGPVYYDLLLAQEVRKLSPNADNTTIYGGTFGFRPLAFINTEAFYYHRDTSLHKTDIDLAVYGAGLNISVENAFAASFYAAFNNGVEAQSALRNTFYTDYNGYAFSGNIDFKRDTDYASAIYSLRVYYASAAKNNTKAYTPISCNLDNGFVFGGSDILRNNNFNAMSVYRSGLPAFMSYSFKVDYRPYFVRNVYGVLALYNFTATNKTLSYRDIGSEIDLEAGYKTANIEFKAMYGFFIAGNGLSSITQSTVESGKNIQKFGLYVSLGLDVF